MPTTIGVECKGQTMRPVPVSVSVFDVLDMYVARHGHYRCLIAKFARAGIITALLYTTDTMVPTEHYSPAHYKSTIVVLLFYFSFISFFLDTLTVYHPPIIV